MLGSLNPAQPKPRMGAVFPLGQCFPRAWGVAGVRPGSSATPASPACAEAPGPPGGSGATCSGLVGVWSCFLGRLAFVGSQIIRLPVLAKKNTPRQVGGNRLPG